MPTLRITKIISADWANIRAIRDLVGNVLLEGAASARDATCMVASELLENAIKYGDHSREHSQLEFVLEVGEETIEVRVTSGVASREHIERLTQRIRETTETGEPESHYLRRASEFVRDSAQAGGLGIYRIRVEGEFMLSAQMENDTLTVVATRRRA